MLSCLKKMGTPKITSLSPCLSFLPSLKSHSLPIPLPIVAQVVWTECQFLWLTLPLRHQKQRIQIQPCERSIRIPWEALYQTTASSSTSFLLFLFSYSNHVSYRDHLSLCRRIRANTLIGGGKEEMLVTLLVAQ